MTLAEKLRDKTTVWDVSRYLKVGLTWEEFEVLWAEFLREQRRRKLQ